MRATQEATAKRKRAELLEREAARAAEKAESKRAESEARAAEREAKYVELDRLRACGAAAQTARLAGIDAVAEQRRALEKLRDQRAEVDAQSREYKRERRALRAAEQGVAFGFVQKRTRNVFQIIFSCWKLGRSHCAGRGIDE